MGLLKKIGKWADKQYGGGLSTKGLVSSVKGTGHSIGDVASNPLVQTAVAGGLALTGAGIPASAAIMGGLKGGGALLKKGGNIGDFAREGAIGAGTGALASGAGKLLHGASLPGMGGGSGIPAPSSARFVNLGGGAKDMIGGGLKQLGGKALGYAKEHPLTVLAGLNAVNDMAGDRANQRQANDLRQQALAEYQQRNAEMSPLRQQALQRLGDNSLPDVSGIGYYDPNNPYAKRFRTMKSSGQGGY